MKRLLSIFIVACALVSCENGGELNGPNNDPKAIAFGSVVTKAPVTNANQILEFGVWAQMNHGKEGEEGYGEYEHILEGERVWRADIASPWGYENTRYWVDNRVFHFFAVYPYGTTATSSTLNQSGSSYDGYRVSFAMDKDADDDLMIAYKTENTDGSGTYPESVSMDFGHILSNVTFNVKKNALNEHADIYLKKAALKNVWKNGAYRTSRFSGYTDSWRTTSVSGQKTTLDIECEYTTTPLPELHHQNYSNAFGRELLILPQTLDPTGDAPIELEITYVYNNNTKTATTVLPAITWEAGKKYTYNVQMHPEDNYIRINTPTVSYWGSSSGGSLLIQ